MHAATDTHALVHAVRATLAAASAAVEARAAAPAARAVAQAFTHAADSGKNVTAAGDSLPWTAAAAVAPADCFSR